MTNNEKPENKEKYIEELERTIDQLKKELEIERNQKKSAVKQKNELERENDNLKKQLAQLQGSAPFLAASCKTAEAGGVPSSKTFVTTHF